jgi:hypothetical protein
MLDQGNGPVDGDTDGSSNDYYDAELLDEMTTSRGELKLRTVSTNDRNRSTSFSDRNRSTSTSFSDRNHSISFNENRHI